MGAVAAAPRHDGGGAGAWVAGRGGLEVVGGVGGVRVTLEALIAAASRLEAAAESLRLGATCLDRAGEDSGGRGAEGLARAASGFTRCAGRASEVAASLRAAAEGYAEAERRARAHVLSIVVGAAALGEAGPPAWGLLRGPALLAGGWALQEWAVVRLLRSSPAGVLRPVPGLSGVAPGPADVLLPAAAARGGVLPGAGLPHGDVVQDLVLALAVLALASGPGRWRAHLRPVEEVAARLAAGLSATGRLLGMPRHEVRVAPAVGGLRREREGGREQEGEGEGAGGGGAPRGVGDLMDLVVAAGAAPAPTIALQRVDHADGSRSWVVAVPGTRDMGVLPGEDPMDMATNLALMADADDDMTAAVEAALLQAGVRPEDPVVLVGHSQGGMVATRIAERWHDTYRIEAVVTAGSPVATMPVPDGVAALALEHAQDWVPALDGLDNPDQPNRTTVVRELPLRARATPLGELGLGVGDLAVAHRADGYAETARVVDGMDHPSVRAFLRRMGDALGDGTTTTQLFTVARVPLPGLGLPAASPAPPAT